MMHGYYGYGLGFGHVGGMLIWLVIIAAVIWLIGWGRRCGSSGRFSSCGGSSESQNANRSDSPLEIAKKRYARGDITLDELNEIKRHLQ